MRVLNTNAYLDEIRALLRQGQDVTIPVVGGSMAPFLVGDRDQVHLIPPGRQTPRVGDIVLYQRANGRYILHRIHRLRGGTYEMLGDAQSKTERGIRREQIFGVANACVRKGKSVLPGSFWWVFFARVWPRLRPVRRPIVALYRALKG